MPRLEPARRGASAARCRLTYRLMFGQALRKRGVASHAFETSAEATGSVPEVEQGELPAASGTPAAPFTLAMARSPSAAPP